MLKHTKLLTKLTREETLFMSLESQHYFHVANCVALVIVLLTF